jgi:hypothetical protein
MELKSYLGAALLAAFTVSPVLAAGTTQDIKPAD